MEPLVLVLFAVLYGISIYTDLKWHKIKNAVTFPVAGIAAVLVVWRYGLRAGLMYVIIAIFASLLTELFRIWGPGDSKLFIAASLLSSLWLGAADLRFISFFLAINILIYLVAGHAYVFYRSGFNPTVYITNLRFGEDLGKMPGALPIAISNMTAIALYYALGH